MALTSNNAQPTAKVLEPDHEGRMIAIGIGMILAFDFAIVLAVLLAVGAQTRDALIVLAIVLGTTFGGMYLITRLMWIPWQRRYPKQPVLEGAVSKSMQSFALPRLCWFNNCLRITVDERHLHLCPFALFAPFGARRMSIPWEAITDVQPGFWPGLLNARLDGLRIRGPSWCLKLAQTQDA